MQSIAMTSLFLFCVLVSMTRQAQSQSEEEARTGQVVAAMTEPAKNQRATLYFEVMMGGEAIGAMSSSLSPAGEERSGSYRYQSEGVIRLADGTRIETRTTSSLNKSFEPEAIELRREVIGPNGQHMSSVDRAEILGKEVVLTHETGGGARTQRRVLRPESPYVFGVEFIVQRVDLKKFQAFAIREFDPQEGNVIVQHFRAESESGGIRRLVSREDDGSIGYVFEIDATGELVSWAEPPLPAVSTRCPRERFAELRKSIQEE